MATHSLPSAVRKNFKRLSSGRKNYQLLADTGFGTSTGLKMTVNYDRLVKPCLWALEL
jgi:hypothetical protein